MGSYEFREMHVDELDRIAEIDRRELFAEGYRVVVGRLESFSVEWQVPAYDPMHEGSYSLQSQIDFCRSHYEAGGYIIGAFHKSRLVGLGVLRFNLRPSIAQVAYLSVTRIHRRKGVASSILHRLTEQALHRNASELYVSSTPSGSAVGFYLAAGFSPTNDLIEELFELEPEDIHMRRTIKP